MQMDVEARARQIVADMGGHWRGSYGMVCCPAHNDRNPSLQVTPGKKAVLFSLPGAFTATCSAKHLPSYVNEDDHLRATGIDLDLSPRAEGDRPLQPLGVRYQANLDEDAVQVDTMHRAADSVADLRSAGARGNARTRLW